MTWPVKKHNPFTCPVPIHDQLKQLTYCALVYNISVESFSKCVKSGAQMC